MGQRFRRPGQGVTWLTLGGVWEGTARPALRGQSLKTVRWPQTLPRLLKLWGVGLDSGVGDTHARVGQW